MSQRAITTTMDRNKRLKEALRDEDRIRIKKETDIYRLTLTFSGDEAAVIKAVLGDRPAEKVLELCRKAMG